MVLEENKNKVDLNKNPDSTAVPANNDYDPIAEMANMLNAYRAANGIKKNKNMKEL